MCNFTPILLQAQEILIVGLSPDESKDSNRVGRYLQNAGFKIIPVYPRSELILGQKVYQDIAQAFENHRPDILVVFRKSEAIPQIATEVLQLNFLPKIFWMQLGIASVHAKSMLESIGIMVIEDKCIKIEHQRIKGLPKEHKEHND